MATRILITGGAGFIGSHLADELLETGYEVRVLDRLLPQVHGPGSERPGYLHSDVELVQGDIRDAETVRRALNGVDAVFHLAAMVGVGQSMYQIGEYTSVNCLGTSILLEEILQQRVERLVVASSMSIYGEGLYRDARERENTQAQRSPARLARGDFDVYDEQGTPMSPAPTPETKPPCLASVYAQTKFDQERLCLMVGQVYGISTVALRFFNVFGTRQALSNPYTGVLAIFASRYLNDRPPMIFEDGQQQRDFVHVRDVARACRLALTVPEADGQTLNVGSGQPRTIHDIALALGAALDKQHLEPEITGEHRVGDIRHCFADIGRARRVLGYEPQVAFEDGLRELVGWIEPQVVVDRVMQARNELARRGLTI
ncbi:MAG TPA: NAD-dependent epimerase/dehydratase family protein [Haliangium sp.]|nr:NAD-dependent epimerase/dehydratase family protein [Haliangium sp.]